MGCGGRDTFAAIMRDALRIVLVTSLALSCRRAPAARPDASVGAAGVRDATRDALVDHVDAPTDATVTRHFERLDTAVPAGRDGGRPRARPTRRAPPVVRGRGPSTVISTRAGALWVRAVNHEADRFTDVLATTLGPDGRAFGESKLLRRTTGPVEALSASVSGEHLWVSWIALRSEDGDTGGPCEVVSVALRASADLATVEPPITLDDVAVFSRSSEQLGGEWWPEQVTRVFARADGGALVVATGGLDRAVIWGGERVYVPVWKEFRIEPEGAHTSVAHSACAAVLDRDEFFELAGSVYYLMTGGLSVTGSGFMRARLSNVGPETPEVPLPDLHDQRDLALAWTGAGFAARGRIANTWGDEREWPGFARFDSLGAIRTPVTPNPYGLPAADDQAAWTPYTLAPLRCVGGHPVATVQWRAGGGGSLTLDPTMAEHRFALSRWIAPGSLPLPPRANGAARDDESVSQLVWTGSALVGLVDGELTRWTCAPSGRVALVP